MQSYKQLRQQYRLMQTLTSCVSQVMRHFPTTYSSSGHFAFQYGRYEDCIQSTAYTYHLIDFNVFNAIDGITMGICLPSECSHNLVTYVLTTAFKLSGAPIAVEKVVTDPQNIKFELGWVFYLTMFVMGLVSLLVAVASLTRKKQNWLQPFRLQQNLATVISHRQSDFSVLNGVRALTIMWIVMGDTFLSSMNGSVNVITLNFLLQRPFALIIQATLLSTDIFFFLSGFFLAYKFSETATNSPAKYPLTFLKKLLRIMPAYLFTLIFYYSVFLHLRTGPKWVLNDQYIDLCKNMWRSIFFVDNLVNNGKTHCMPWGFYLQIQMQLYVVSLVLLLLYRRSRLGSLILAALLVAYSWTINLIYTQQNEQKFPITLQAIYTFKDYIFDVYLKPQYRCAPYFYGLFLALGYREFLEVQAHELAEKQTFLSASVGVKMRMAKQKLQQRRLVRLGVEWFGMFLLCLQTFLARNLQLGGEWPQWFHSFCINFGRIVYPFAITLVVGPTLLGVEGSLFRTLLDTKFFNFLSRISYGVFLVHGMAIFYINWGNKTDTYLSITNTYVISLSAIILSIFFGFLLTVTIEIPFRRLFQRYGQVRKEIIEREGLLTKEQMVGGKEGESETRVEINQTITE